MMTFLSTKSIAAIFMQLDGAIATVAKDLCFLLERINWRLTMGQSLQYEIIVRLHQLGNTVLHGAVADYLDR